MGPGGKATAAGLYSLAGVSAYLVVAALLVVAVRVFRGRPLYRSLGEVFGVLGLLAGSTMLLHLPFAGERDRAARAGRPAGAVAGRGDRQLRGHGGRGPGRRRSP